MNFERPHYPVVIIGAGPAGSVAAALLRQRGYPVLVLEKAHFPRFSIGESLLPQSMGLLAEAGLLDAVNDAGFRFKDGAVFDYDGNRQSFDFREKYGDDEATAFQVQRAGFDQILADGAARQGAEIHFGQEITSVEFRDQKAVLTGINDDGKEFQVQADFVLDASGFGRVLPRLLDLEIPTGFPERVSLFTHIRDPLDGPGFDRDKILITVHPQNRDIWYWLIPFNDGTASLGVVGEPVILGVDDGASPESQLKQWIASCPTMSELLAQAEFYKPVHCLRGYAAKVRQLAGPNYALLGNAGEFLDPVFSSGVTIALKSASLATAALDRQLQGQEVDWQREYSEPLQAGVDVFRTYVNAWYDGRFQDVIFHQTPNPVIKEMICAILAGYVWDGSNPYVAQPERRLKTLVEVCRA